jgi:hypothetical protein
MSIVIAVALLVLLRQRHFLDGKSLVDIALDHTGAGMAESAENERCLLARHRTVERRTRVRPAV